MEAPEPLVTVTLGRKAVASGMGIDRDPGASKGRKLRRLVLLGVGGMGGARSPEVPVTGG